jgi:hypothetical protein
MVEMPSLEDIPSLKRGLGGLLLILGLALLAFLLFALGKDLSLWVFGETASAQVVDRWAEPTNAGEQEELSFDYYVRYRFTTPGGKVIFTTKTVAAQEWVGVGHSSRGQGATDFYTGEEVGASAPVYQEQAHLSEFSEGGLMSAEEVRVVYFPLFPAHNRLEESRFVPLLACTYVPFLAVAGLLLVAGRYLLKKEPVWEDDWPIQQVTALTAEN